MAENSEEWVVRPKPTSVAAMVDRAEPPDPSPGPGPRPAAGTQAWRNPAVVGGAVGAVVLAALVVVLRRRR